MEHNVDVATPFFLSSYRTGLYALMEQNCVTGGGPVRETQTPNLAGMLVSQEAVTDRPPLFRKAT